MHDQITPFSLLILWVLLLAESMVEAVRLRARVLEFEIVVRQFDTV